MSLEHVKVTVHAYDITVEPEVLNPTTGLTTTNIHLWTLDRDSRPYLIRIDNYETSVNVILPELVGGITFDWNPQTINEFLAFVAAKLDAKRPTGYEFHRSSVIYYDHGDRKFPMIRFNFRSLECQQALARLLARPITIYRLSPLPMLFNVCETNVDIIRKMMTSRDCQFSQWFSIEGIIIPPDSEYRIQVDGPEDRPLNEIVAGYETLTPIPTSVSMAWSTKPRIVAFDIETYSNNHKAMPNEFNPLHCTNIITCVCQVKGDASSRVKYAFVMGNCPPITDAIIVNVVEEDDLLEGMAELVRGYCPEIIIGYNIISFDYRYLDTRLKNKLKQWPLMGRIKGKIPNMNIMSWKSSAYGENKLFILEADGIISIDMLPLIKRDYKLDKYDLDSVSKHFIGRGKHDVKFSKMFQAHEKTMFIRDIIEKVVEEITLDDPEIFDDRSLEVDSYDQAMQLRVDIMQDAVRRGKLSSRTLERTKKTLLRYDLIRDEVQKYVAYGLEDAVLCIDLFDKLNIWEGLIQLSNVVGITIMQLFTRGQQIRFLSQVYHMATKMGIVINKRTANKLFFNGGFVFEPVQGTHENVICLDFASLYPSIMMAKNICLSTLVPPERADAVTDDYAETIAFDQEEPRDGKPKRRSEDNDGNDFFDAEDDPDHDEEKSEDLVIRSYSYKWVKRSVREGVIPRCVRELVEGRSAVKGEIKNVNRKLEPLEDTIPHVDRALNNKWTLSELLTDIEKQYAKTKQDQMEAETDKERSFLQLGLEELDGILTTLRESPLTDMVAISNDISQRVASYRLQCIILDKRQNAMKVSANSMYGALGAQNGGVLPLIEGAMSVTAVGRRLINQVNIYLKEKYKAIIVYNDTDSVFVDLKITDSKEAYARGIALSNEISGTPAKYDKSGILIRPEVPGLFPPPLKMEFEKAMRVTCLRKKKYAALLINQDGSFVCDKKTGELVILQRGIVLQRRDTCKYLFKIYRSLLMAVLQRRPLIDSYRIIINAVADLIQGKVPARGNLTVIKELGSAYKSENFSMKVFADHLQQLGRPPNPGDRLEYVIVRTPEDEAGSDVKLGKKMRDFAMYEEAWELEHARRSGQLRLDDDDLSSIIFDDEDDPLKVVETPGTYQPETLDYMYYIEHLLTSALDQLFGVGYREELKKVEHLHFKPFFNKRLRKTIPVSQPLAMIGKMWQDYSYGGYTLQQFGEIIPGLADWFDGELSRA